MLANFKFAQTLPVINFYHSFKLQVFKFIQKIEICLISLCSLNQKMVKWLNKWYFLKN